jgi:hypothetical protein
LLAGLGQHHRQQIEKMQSGSFKQIVGRMKKMVRDEFLASEAQCVLFFN